MVAAFCPVDGKETGVSAAERTLSKKYKGPRRTEFFAGRRAAQILDCGGPVLADESGAPIFPPGWSGSIAHTSDLAVAAAVPSGIATIGVDLENLAPEYPGISTVVLHDKDGTPSDWEGLLRLFSLKEALYKALYPHVLRVIGFDEVSVGPSIGEVVEFSLHFECKKHLCAFGASKRIKDAMFTWAWVQF